MLGNGVIVMTKRKKSSNLVKARKETKRLQREAKTRLRKAMREAQESNDDIELQRLERVAKNFAKSLLPTSKENLPKSFKNNVMRERGKALNLEHMLKKSDLSKKAKKRQTRKTFNRIFGEEKTGAILGKIGGRKMARLSNEFWEQLYKAQDMLFSMGIVPADEIMGRWGSIGSGLLEVGTKLVNDGYWTSIKIDIDPKNNGTWVVLSEQDDKVTETDLASAIVTWYKKQYGLE